MTIPTACLGAHVEQGPLRWADLPPPWLLTVLVLVGFLWIRSIYIRERGNAGPLQRLGLALLRTAVLVLVLLILGGPFRQEETKTIERSHLVVLVDSSASMRVKDQNPKDEERRLIEAAFMPGERPPSLAGVSRGELIKRVLAPAGEAMLRRWAERFVVHVFSFDSDWRSLGVSEERVGTRGKKDDDVSEDLLAVMGEALRSLPLNGGRTRLGAVLRSAANEFGRRQDQHLAGVVLLSDGRDTSDGEPPQDVLATMGEVKHKLHVAAIGLGNPASGKNLWVERIRAKDVVLVRDEVIFESALRHTDFEDHNGPIRVWMDIQRVADEQGNPVPPRPYKVPHKDQPGLETEVGRLGRVDGAGRMIDPNAPTPIRLKAPLNNAGTFRVAIHAEFVDEEDRRLDSVPEDDVSYHEIRVVDQRIKVLYVDNLPRHDWRFLSTYLTREPGQAQASRFKEARSRFQVHVLLQSADPAFRQPASVGETPIKSFPRTRRELFAYDVIILGDVDWRQFDPTGVENSRKILELLARFVEEGGGLALQAGVDCRNPIDFLDTPLAPLLPINVRHQDKGNSEDMARPFRVRLTNAGVSQPIFAVVPGEDGGVATPNFIAATWAGDDNIPLSEDWVWYWLYRAAGGLRPGAIDLARVKADDMRGFKDQRDESLVVFASMGYGKGQVFWAGLDTISRIRRAQRDRIYGAFWEQIIRYLATYRLLGGNKRFKIFTDKDEYLVGETATITITALDEQFEPLTDDFLDGVHIEMGDDSSTAKTTLLEGPARPRSMREEGATGTYRLDLPLKTQGLVRVWIDRASAGVGRAGKERAEKRFEVNFRAREDLLKVPDHETLRDIVQQTNPQIQEAKVYKLHELDDVVKAMQSRPRERVLDRRERTQWDKTWVLLLITALLATEWLLRKRWQMI